jgi:deazaflavin-dependent oxidoreductase (nitroreductase family)
MDRSVALGRSRQVGVLTLAIGGVLIGRPRLGGVADLDERETRLVALIDLAVAPGLIWGRPRRPWVFARVGANVAIAAMLLRRRSPVGRAAAIGLAAASASDLQLAAALREGAPEDAGPSLNARLNLAAADAMSDRGVYLGRRSTKAHVALYRRSGGRIGRKVPGFPGAEIALVDHRGARTGTPRTSPLMCLRDGESIAVVASKAGQPTHPAWFHNLRANPETTVQIGGEVLPVRARIADETERQRLFAEFVAVYPGYESYRERAHPRVIPIVILDPRP